jgi:hypothetical protein
MSVETAVRPPTSYKAVIAFALAVVSLGLWLVAALPALAAGIVSLVLATLALRQTRRAGTGLRGRGLAWAGIVTAVLGGLVFGAVLPGVEGVREATRRTDSI